MSERVLTHNSEGIAAYAAAVAISTEEVADLVDQLTTYGIVQPDIDTYYRMLKKLATP